MKTKHFLDGKLFRWMVQYGLVQGLHNTNLLKCQAELSDLSTDIARMVAQARKEGANWIWNEKDIKVASHCRQPRFELPSVDICSELGLDTHNQLRSYFCGQGFDTSFIEWDTESNAWYPLFTSKANAKACIKMVNEVFDRRWIRSQV